MSEFKFSCPQCGQKMFGDDHYAGTQITCPACQNEIVVPRMQPVSVARVQVETVAVVTPRQAPRPMPATPVRAAYMPKDPAGDGTKTKMMVTVGIICLVILCPIIFYFAFPDQVSALENKFGFAGKKVDPEAGGGQLGHIAELYSVLDATDPDKMSSSRGPNRAEVARLLEEERLADAKKAEEEALADLQLGEASWNLDRLPEEFPTGKPHGSISGTNFVADIVRLDNQSSQYLLTMRQGTNGVPDCEMLVYLQLKPNEQMAGKTWTISANQKTGAPQVVKKWKANPKFAPLQKIYGGGYAMKLEFGENDSGQIAGQIYVALPDPEKSFVAGRFRIGEKRVFQFEPSDF
jgi:hypothetical protein